MFKTIQISKAIWWGVRSCSHSMVATSNVFIAERCHASAGSLFAVGFEYVSPVWARPLSSALPEGHLSWVSPDAWQSFYSS